MIDHLLLAAVVQFAPSTSTTHQTQARMASAHGDVIRVVGVTRSTTCVLDPSDWSVEAETFTNALRTMNSDCGLPWTAIARAVGVSRQALYNWMAGESPTSDKRNRVLALSDAVAREVDGMTPQAARAHLMANSDGQTRLARHAAAAPALHSGDYLPSTVELLARDDTQEASLVSTGEVWDVPISGPLS